MSKRKDLNIEIEKKQSRKKKQTPEKKLERLLNPLRNAEGKLPQSYLTTEAGKEILALALVYEKELGGWDIITELLERKTTIIHSAMRKHQLTRNRLAGARNYSDRTSWNSNPDVCKLIEDYFKHSKKFQAGNELNTLKKNLLAVVAQSLKRTVTWNSVLIFAKDKEWHGWGMSNKERENADRVIFDEILRDKTLSPQEMRDKLKQTLYIKDKGLLSRAKQLDITLPALKQARSKDYWENTEFISRIKQLIERDHILVKSPSINDALKAIVAVMQKEFADVIKQGGQSFSATKLNKKLNNILLTHERRQNIKTAVKNNVSAQEYSKYDSSIPLSLVEGWMEEIHGTTTKRFPPTFLKNLEDFDPAKQKEILTLPRGTFDDPVVFDDSIIDGGIDFFNSLEFGTDYNPDIEENLPRQSFASAEKRGVGAIILTNIMDIHVKKTASSNLIELAGISSHLLDENSIELLDPDYQETAREALAEIRRDPTTERMIYAKPIDTLKLNLKGIYKVAYKTGKKSKEREPEYSGPTYVVLSNKDEEIISAMAGARSAENTISQRGRVDAKLRIARTERARIEDYASIEHIEELDHEIALLEAEREYTKVSWSAKNNSERYREQMLSLLIRGYEAAIPNCKVIGIGTTYVKIGGIIHEIYIPGDTQVTDTYLQRYASSYGPKVLRNKFADVAIVCPQFSPNYQQVAREHSGEGDRKSSHVFATPMLIDDKYLRQKESTGRIIRTSAHKLLKVLRSELTCTGVLHLDYDGIRNEIVSPATFPISTFAPLSKLKIPLLQKAPAIITTKKYGDEPFFLAMISTDPHRGGRAREIIWSPEKRMYLGVHEACIDLMERGGLYTDPLFPVPTFFFVCDDIVQGLHFPAYSQTHPHLISQGDMERLWAEEIKRAKESRDADRMYNLMETMHKELSYQRRIQGTDWVEHQLLEASKEMLEPYARFYHLAVANAVDCELELLGMSHYERVRNDDRDLGFINWTIAGNHHARSVDGHVAEGNRIARENRLLLRALPDVNRWRNNPEILDKLIRAPNFSGEFIGGATVRLPGGNPWGILGRNSPTTLSSWGAPIAAAMRKELQRGDHLGFQRFVDSTLMIVGDKHFDSSYEAEWLKGEMGPAGTKTDRYGQKGFPPNNTGIKFVLFPAGGPGRGPILRRTLMSWNLRYYIENPSEQINWKHFLSNVVRAG